MFVCSCKAVTDRTVRAAIASGATCIEEIAERCGAGSRCGGCWPELERLLHEHDAASSHARVAVA
jgi:bacterioferritin-associated ferredoxin